MRWALKASMREVGCNFGTAGFWTSRVRTPWEFIIRRFIVSSVAFTGSKSHTKRGLVQGYVQWQGHHGALQPGGALTLESYRWNDKCSGVLSAQYLRLQGQCYLAIAAVIAEEVITDRMASTLGAHSISGM